MSFLERAAALHAGEVRRGPGADSRLRGEFEGEIVELSVCERPALVISAACAHPPGVSLSLHATGWGEQESFLPRRDIAVGDAHFDVHFFVRASDEGFARLWLDSPVRNAMIGVLRRDPDARPGGVIRRYFMRPTADEAFVVRGYDATVAHQRVQLTRGKPEPHFDWFLAALRATAALATRPRRLTSEWAAIAHDLGGTATGDWAADEKYALRVGRSGVELRIAFLVHVPGEDLGQARLRTRLSCRRLASAADRWLLWRASLPRAHRPSPPAGLEHEHLTVATVGGRYVGSASDPRRIHSRLGPLESLIVSAEPDVIESIGEELVILFEGVPASSRLRSSLDLAIALAIEVAPSGDGPYR